MANSITNPERKQISELPAESRFQVTLALFSIFVAVMSAVTLAKVTESCLVVKK